MGKRTLVKQMALRTHSGVSEVSSITITPLELRELARVGKPLKEYLRRYSTMTPTAMSGAIAMGAGVVGLAAELMKKDNEYRLMHEMLTDAGIPEDSASGEGICLIGRLAVLIERGQKS